jgi:hypothetical protein
MLSSHEAEGTQPARHGVDDDPVQTVDLAHRAWTIVGLIGRQDRARVAVASPILPLDKLMPEAMNGPGTAPTRSREAARQANGGAS